MNRFAVDELCFCTGSEGRLVLSQDTGIYHGESRRHGLFPSRSLCHWSTFAALSRAAIRVTILIDLPVWMLTFEIDSPDCRSSTTSGCLDKARFFLCVAHFRFCLFSTRMTHFLLCFFWVLFTVSFEMVYRLFALPIFVLCSSDNAFPFHCSLNFCSVCFRHRFTKSMIEGSK